MNVTSDLSFTHLVLQASVPVQLIMLILALLSVMSWYWIFRKIFQIRDARRRTDAFEASFWQGSDLETLARLTESRLQHAGPMELVFLAAWREFLRQRSRSLDPTAALESVRRAMRAAYQREMDELEAHLAFLASTGSVAPYIGLLGTVWGIMNSFRGLANMTSATLAHAAGFSTIEIPADREGPAMQGAVWTPCAAPAGEIRLGRTHTSPCFG